ncbi:FIST signal transduction protein [Clostridium sp. WILCCON 0269]|uniref:FIST signal transduction protein n=1 Tax=Candidatus Clostridium eludens TaxID=3381663 RepID=A0ABW8SM67_9CLOT
MKALYFSKVQEAISFIRGTDESRGVVLFCSADNVKELSKNNDKDIVLCSTAGEYTYAGYKDGVITGFEYDRKEAEIVEISYPPILSVNELKKAYGNVKNNKNAFMLLLCDGLKGIEESILSTFYFIDSSFKIIGGSAGDNERFEETYIYVGNRRVMNVALFFNLKRRTSIIKENIYVKTEKILRVTEADVVSRKVKTFNNKPASTEYAYAVGVSENKLPEYFMSNPLGKLYENDILIASPMKVNEDKSITFYSELMVNTFVYLLKPAEPIGVLKETLRDVSFKPSFVLSINCIFRKLLFVKDKIWENFDKEMISFCKNTTGFVSYGEQYYKKHLNQTMVMLMVE